MRRIRRDQASQYTSYVFQKCQFTPSRASILEFPIWFSLDSKLWTALFIIIIFLWKIMIILKGRELWLILTINRSYYQLTSFWVCPGFSIKLLLNLSNLFCLNLWSQIESYVFVFLPCIPALVLLSLLFSLTFSIFTK